MPGNAYSFTENSARRIAQAVRDVERKSTIGPPNARIPLPGFWARLTSHSLVSGKTYCWSYGWTQQQRTATGFQDLSTGQTSSACGIQAYNVAEANAVQASAADTVGSGVIWLVPGTDSAGNPCFTFDKLCPPSSTGSSGSGSETSFWVDAGAATSGLIAVPGWGARPDNRGLPIEIEVWYCLGSPTYAATTQWARWVDYYHDNTRWFFGSGYGLGAIRNSSTWAIDGGCNLTLTLEGSASSDGSWGSMMLKVDSFTARTQFYVIIRYKGGGTGLGAVPNFVF